MPYLFYYSIFLNFNENGLQDVKYLILARHTHLLLKPLSVHCRSRKRKIEKLPKVGKKCTCHQFNVIAQVSQNLNSEICVAFSKKKGAA